MAFLRRALLLFAAVWGVCGTAIAVSPRWILVSWFDQVPYPDYTYVRVCGIAGLSSAWFWWIFAVTNIVLVAGLVSGIARAGVEKPIV